MHYFLRLLFAVIGVGAAVYVAICISMFFGQKRLIFVPSKTIEITPEKLGLTYEEVWLSASNQAGGEERIHGWWLPTATADVLLYLHGNGCNMGSNLSHAQRFRQLGFSVLLIDYRGYGRSEGGFPNEAQVYQDAQVAWDYLVQQREIEPQNIFIYGHSLGGAIAIDLAVRNLAAGLIVEGTFTSMLDMGSYRRQYNWLPINLLLTQRFDSLAKIKSIQLPLLLIHASDDLVVPAHMSQLLYEAAEVPKQLLLVPGAGHNNAASVGGDRYLQAVRDFYQLVRNHHQLAQH